MTSPLRHFKLASSQAFRRPKPSLLNQLGQAQRNIPGAASLVFVASFYLVSVRKDNLTVFFTHPSVWETLIFGALTFVASLNLDNRSRGTILLAIVIGCALFLVQVPYILLYHTHPLVGQTIDYVIAFVKLYVFLLAICCYGLILYQESALVAAFWRVGQIILMVSIGAYVLYVTTGTSFLLHFYGFEPRIQGFFTEPSAFAPMLAAFTLLGLQKRALIWVLVALAAVILTGSPTVYLTVALAVPAVVFLRRHQLGRTTVLVTGVLSVAGVCLLVVGNIEFQVLLHSQIGFLYSLGRLLAGFQNIVTLGGTGQNVRFADAINVYQTLRDHDLFLSGYGLNSSSVYFQKLYGDAKDHSLFLTVLFSYGLPGLAAFVFLCAKALVGLARESSDYIYIFAPFLVASSINSAEGFETYKFVLLGILVFWLGKRQLMSSATSSEPSARGKSQASSSVAIHPGIG